MIFLYKVAIFLYSLVVRIFSHFNEKARFFVKGRKNWRKNLAEKIDGNERYIWFHCASLGEFEQGRPVIEEIKKQFPERKIALTFFSPSGYEIRKNYDLADIVAYLPCDTKKNARDFISLLNPEKVFFVKYEFWYFYISELKQREIPLFIISAIFRKNQQFFKNTPWGKFYRKMLFQFEHIFIQDEPSAQLLKSIGITNYTVSGDTRFDRVAAIARNSKDIPAIEKFRGNTPLLVAGSTWKPDEELLVEYINNNRHAKFIIAPHEVSEVNINRLLKMLKVPTIRFSLIEKEEIDNFRVIVIDSIGLLSSVYRYGSVAYIGGGFGVGIHNILEAATFGLPIIFGPNYSKFKEAVDLKSRGGAFTISNFNQLEVTAYSLLYDNEAGKKASETCLKYIAENVGSTALIVKKLLIAGPVS